MEIEASRRVSVFDRIKGQPLINQVCVFWLKGRCNRNPCRFMHRLSPPLQPELPHLASSRVNLWKQSKKITWRNPNDHIHKTGRSGNSNKTIQQKVLTNTVRESDDMICDTVITSTGSDSGLQTQQKLLTTEEPGSESQCAKKTQLKQCQYWVTGNCVHGDKCRDLHSWFCGSGFTMLTKLDGHTKDITGIALPSGSEKLYSSSNDGCIYVWDCNSGQRVNSVSLDGEIGCLATKGTWLFAGLPNVVKAWNLQNQTEVSLNGPVGQVHCMVVDGDMLFAGIEDGTILVWKWHCESNIPELTAMLKGHKGAVCSLVTGAKRLYSGSRDCTIRVWDLRTLQCVQVLNGHSRDVTSVLCWDSYLLSASLDNTLKVWAATESGIINVIYELKDDHGFVALCGIHDTEAQPILLCACKDNTVCLYDLPSFTERGRIFSNQGTRVIQIGIGGLFFTGDATGQLSVWKLLEAPQESLIRLMLESRKTVSKTQILFGTCCCKGCNNRSSHASAISKEVDKCIYAS